MRAAAALGVLAALAAAGHGVATSRAAFTAHEEFSASVSTAADWVAPAVTLTAPADDSFQASTTVTLSGAAGTASGDVASVTVNVYSGTSATGTPVATRTVTPSAGAWSTSVTGLAQGTYTAQARQFDGAGNTGTSATRTFTIDTTAPTRVSIASANAAGGTAGHLDAGDTVTFTYSEEIVASSILPGWTGASAATVNVRFFNGTTDRFTVLDSASAANVRLDAGTTTSGGVTFGTGGNYVTNTVTFTGSSMTRSADGRSFTVVLGTPNVPSRVASTQTPAANMTWTPKAGPADLAGNALASTATWTETDNDRDF